MIYFPPLKFEPFTGYLSMCLGIEWLIYEIWLLRKITLQTINFFIKSTSFQQNIT